MVYVLHRGQWTLTAVAAHKDFIGYMYDGDDRPRTHSIMWRSENGALWAYQRMSKWEPVRPVAVRMRVAGEE